VEFTNLTFLETSSPAGTVVPSALTLGVAPAGTTNVVGEFHLTTVPSERSFAVTAGVPEPRPGQQPLVLVQVDTTKRPWVAATIPNGR
jgi:hypothetical protein